MKAKRSRSAFLAILLTLVTIFAGAEPVFADGWVDHISGRLVPDQAIEGTITSADYLSQDDDYYKVYSFTMESSKTAVFYMESEIPYYMTDTGWADQLSYLIYKSGNVDTSVWDGKISGTYSSGRNKYYGSVEVPLDAGNYYFVMKCSYYGVDAIERKLFSLTFSERDVIVNVQGITLSAESLSMMVGEESTLTAKVTPANATDPSVKWSSSDESIAIVEDGKVTAVSSGEAIITAASSDGEVSATCKVKVRDNSSVATDIAFDKKEITCYLSEKFQLIARITPEEAVENTEIIIKNSNESVVKVSESGYVTTVSPGEAEITITTDNGLSDTCKIIVNVKGTEIKKVSGGKKKITVRWNKVDLSNGYEVRYSKNSDFSGATTLTVDSSLNKTNIKKLKKGTYYVSVRSCTYSELADQYYFSEWSVPKKVKVK